MKNTSTYIDIVFCVVVLPAMAMIFPIERWMHNFPIYMVSVAVWLYAVYITNRVFTVPFLFSSGKKRLLGIALIILTLLITLLLSGINLYIPKPNIHDEGIVRIFPSVLQYKQAVWSLFMIVEAFSFAVGLLTQANIQKSRCILVEAERDKAELSLYKAQIKPHFMFNTLNSLYGLSLTNDPKAIPSLEKYISMLRYVYSTSGKDFISLAEEEEYIRQYVGLQSLRLSDKTSVEMQINIEDSSLMIPPMLLVTFVENCFKHGVSPDEKSVIEISLAEKNSRLTFTTKNTVFKHHQASEQTGISNCKKRLNLIYPDNHTLEYGIDGTSYNVKLQITLSNDQVCGNR